MGTGVAMRTGLGIFLAFALWGCGPGATTDPFAQLGPLAGEWVQSREDRGNDGFTVTRASLAAQGFESPFLVGFSETRMRRAGLVQVAENRGVVTWQAGDASTLSEAGGVLTGTRGLGQDLYTAETAPVLAAMRGDGPMVYTRRYRHLDGLDQIVVTRFDCHLADAGPERITVFGQAYATRRFQETCRSGTDRIENTYWRDTDNFSYSVMRRSRQWVGTDLGYILLERVID